MQVLLRVSNLSVLDGRLEPNRLRRKPHLNVISQVNPVLCRCLRLIAKAVTHFTMYLSETGQTHIKNDVQLINRILNTMGLVITEDIYCSELNPKNKQPTNNTPKHPENLLEELEPYFDNSSSHKEWEKYYSM